MLSTNLPTNLLQIITNPLLIIGFIIFIIISYFLISLLTQSFTKSLKYLSISFFIVGFSILLIRFSFPLIINSLLADAVNIPTNITSILLIPLLKNGIICALAGIAFMMIYILVNNLSRDKNAKENKLELENN